MNESVKVLLQQLGDAINESVVGSARIESIMQAIRDSGYEVYLMLEANIAVENIESNHKEDPETQPFTEDDQRFLKRLKIDC